MNTRQIILAGIVIVALLLVTGTVVAQENSSAPAISNPENIPIGPGNPLFGLKIAIENLDETFTFNDTRRIEKQIDHAEARIQEVQQELKLNQSGYADQALELYQEKLNQTEAALPHFSSSATGLLHVQEVIVRHKTVLANLLSRYPNSSGLARAYNNSQILEAKFGEKTRTRFERVTEENNTTTLKAVKMYTEKHSNAGGTNNESTGSSAQGRNESQDRVKDKKNENQVTPTITLELPTLTDDTGNSKDQGKKGHN